MQTPYIEYNLTKLNENLNLAKREADKYNFHIHYALKANYDPNILDAIHSIGFGVDCVSGNEIQLAMDSNFKPNQVFYAGVGKMDNEIEYALELGIKSFNVESFHELEVISAIAEKMNTTANVCLRINPNISAHTHPNIATGNSYNKFGIAKDELEEIAKYLHQNNQINFQGIHFHIGSQITTLDNFVELTQTANSFIDYFNNVLNLKVQILNLGGGLGIDYQNPNNYLSPFDSFFKIINDNLKNENRPEIHFELGRSIVGQVGTIYSKVIFQKKIEGTTLNIVDAGMTELLRPSLYKASHKISSIGSNSEPSEKQLISGPICESSDTFGQHNLPKLNRNDIIAIHSCGAYVESMKLNYNLRNEMTKVYV